MKMNLLLIGMPILSCVTLATAATPAVVPQDNPANRPVQSSTDWVRNSKNLIGGFCNMYQPCVVEVPNSEWRYLMWFFGWSAADTNPGHSGCDAIFHARSRDLKTWEIYSGGNQWDATMNPKRWAPVLTASTKWFDAWHDGDPSVVLKDGRFYMAFSSTGRPGAAKGHPLNMLMCLMGATSSDGIHWEKTNQPLLVESEEAQKACKEKNWSGSYSRPCLRWEQGKWRLWFDYWINGKGMCMGYAENTGDFGAPGGFPIPAGGFTPQIVNWPNPEVIKVGDRYYSFADPVGYPPNRSSINTWIRRQMCEAVSEDGLHWKVVGFLPPDPDAPACHVPQALVTKIDGADWLYLFYATQRGGSPVYDYRYDHIRAMRRPLAMGEGQP